ncbi:MAG: hypothetical protein JW726_07975 [Anaerolineales bacterium]|nr:hypothetical protein [Anaerolineales bacterium]
MGDVWRFVLNPDRADPVRIYLPVVHIPDRFVLDTPVWAHNQEPNAHEVALFRIPINLTESLDQAELHIFADTRYEAWLDGVWIGRGPARFTSNYREYDIHPLELSEPGEHLLAILVQWAPETRRSESVRPMVQGHITGITPSGISYLLRSGSQWRALLSNAWNPDSALIHEWNLIGPTELLDLGLLDQNWLLPEYDDSAWIPAVTVNPYREIAGAVAGAIKYYPRSILFPINRPVNAIVLDAGLLSPGFSIREFPLGEQSSYNLPFQVTGTTVFTIETLAQASLPITGTVLLDGNQAVWQPAGTSRPDVFHATYNLDAGAHLLSFLPGAAENDTEQSLILAFSTANTSDLSAPLTQGEIAGRRLLLAEPVSSPGSVTVTTTQNLKLQGGVTADSVSALRLNTLPSYVVLDLGRTTYGRLVAQVHGSAGTVLDIGWDERLYPGTLRPLPYPGRLNQSWNQVDSWVLDGNVRSITTIDARAGRYILLAAWGTEPVWLEDIQIIEETYPLTQTGSFSSSDPLLDQIWQIGVTSVHANMVDAYMDPWRERGQWWGDAFVDDQVNKVAFGDASLLQRGILLMANTFENEGHAPGLAPQNQGQNLLDYTMLWVHSLSDYYERTGDTALLIDKFGTLCTFMIYLAGYENAETNLIDLPQTHWSETAYIESLGFHSRYGQSTAVNAMYYSTLLRAAEIADLLENATLRDAWQARATNVRSSVNSLLYLPDEQRYLTNIYQNTPYPPTPQAQAWALAYNLVPQGQRPAVTDALLELLSSDPSNPNVEIYGFYWVLEALGHTGHITEATDLIKDYYERLIQLGATTWWENFKAIGNYRNSLSHGWGSSPTWFLTTYLLGARQTGTNNWVVQPALEGVSYAAGILPLPQGALDVAWQIESCQDPGVRQAQIHLVAPAATSGQVILPTGISPLSITLDGRPITGQNTSPDLQIELQDISIFIEEGTHTLLLELACTHAP